MNERRQKPGKSPSRKVKSPKTLRAAPDLSARGLAFAILADVRDSGEFARSLSERRFSQGATDDRERRLCEELIYGVLRRRRTLENVLRAATDRSLDRIEPDLQLLALLGIYQLVFLDTIPAHAAVHETVELAKRLDRPRWCGFLNGLLRGVTRLLTDERADVPAANHIPLTSGDYRVLQRKVFADPADEPIGYLSDAFGLPDWLIARWGRSTDFAALLKRCFWLNRPIPPTLRVNALRTDRQRVLQEFQSIGIEAEAGRLPELIHLKSSQSIPKLPGFERGWWTVQDETAYQACRLLSPRPGESLLDLCAAPGTKTTALAEIMENRGSILATDVSASRLNAVVQNTVRLGIDIVKTKIIPDIKRTDFNAVVDALRGDYHAVLVDAPCSNTGVMGKRVEVRERLTLDEIGELSQLQYHLLRLAIELVRPDGRVVYSTCSIEPEENQRVVERIRQEFPSLQCVEEQSYMPGQPADGGYSVLLKK